MINDPISVFRRHGARLGDTFVFYFGGAKKSIVTSNPALMQHVLKTNYDNYGKSDIQLKRMGQFLGEGLLTSHGRYWHTQRKLIQQGFHRDQLAALMPVMHQIVADCFEELDRMAGAGPVEMSSMLKKITFRTVGRSLFSTHLKESDIDFISNAISTVQEFMVRQIVQPYLQPWHVLSGELAHYQGIRSQGDAIVMGHIRRRRTEEQPSNDLLQILLDARYDDGSGMDDMQILSESMQLLVAGHETSSNGLAWAMYLLTQHPEWVSRIREELRTVAKDRPLQFDDLPKMEVTTQVIDEALRLYPPFWMVDRMALEDDEAGGVAIPKGSTIIVFIHGVHHSPRYWDSPEEFRPERFTREQKKRLTPFTYLPFGGGPKGCIGGNYAMMQMILILTSLVSRYDFEIAPGHAIEPRPMIILRPRWGLPMLLARSDKALV
jgi:cytochrome P450